MGKTEHERLLYQQLEAAARVPFRQTPPGFRWRDPASSGHITACVPPARQRAVAGQKTSDNLSPVFFTKHPCVLAWERRNALSYEELGCALKAAFRDALRIDEQP